MIIKIGDTLAKLNDGVLIFNQNKELSFKNDSFFKEHRDISIEFDRYFPRSSMDIENSFNVAGQEYLISGRRVEIDKEFYYFVTLKKVSCKNTFKVKAYEQVLESLNEGVLVTDHKDRIVIVNHAMENLDNIKKDQAIGRTIPSVYGLEHPNKSEHKFVYDTAEPLINQYVAHNTQGDVPQYVSYNTYPLMDDGIPIGAFSVGTNETKLTEMLHETMKLKRKLYKAADSAEDTIEPDNGTMYNFSHIRGVSRELKNTIKEAQHVSLHNNDLLIVGETGVGKELFAQSIHNHSPYAAEPFVAINCAAIPENLLETTLFGSVKGAFTGSENQKGLFEYAGEGTLFLDEVNSMSMLFQSKLLRALEERRVRRVGSNKSHRIRCRVISASNEDPQILIKEDRLRLDFFYRIAKYVLSIEPLRKRTPDIEYYLQHFLEKYNDSYNKKLNKIDPVLKSKLLHYSWPGNVRELEHIIESTVIYAGIEDETLTESHIPPYIRSILSGINVDTKKGNVKLTKEIIEAALEESDNNISAAARALGVSRQSLQYHIRKINDKK